MKNIEYEGYKNYHDDDIICTCSYVSRKEIMDVIKKYKVKSVEEITELSGAGSGCGFCLEDLEKILNGN